MQTYSGPETKYGALRLAWPPAGVMLVLAAGSFAADTPASPDVDGFDKLAHFCVFGLLGTLLFRRLRIGFFETRRWALALAGVVAFGVLDECLQYFNPERSFDVFDWVADFAGAALAIFLYRNWAWYRNLLELPLWGGLPSKR